MSIPSAWQTHFLWNFFSYVVEEHKTVSWFWHGTIIVHSWHWGGISTLSQKQIRTLDVWEGTWMSPTIIVLFEFSTIPSDGPKVIVDWLDFKEDLVLGLEDLCCLYWTLNLDFWLDTSCWTSPPLGLCLAESLIVPKSKALEMFTFSVRHAVTEKGVVAEVLVVLIEFVTSGVDCISLGLRCMQRGRLHLDKVDNESF